MNNKNDFKATRLEPEEKVRQSFSRIVLAFAAITFAFSILLFLSQSFQVYIRVTYHVDPELVAITLFLASLMTFFMGYLEQDFSIFARSFVLGMQTSKNLRMASSKAIDGTEVEVIKNALGEALSIAIAEGRELNPQRNSPTESPNVDRPVIDSHIQRAELGLLADRPISRMKHEIEGMSRRANLNLVIGMRYPDFLGHSCLLK